MAVTFQEIQNLISANIGSVKNVSITADSSNRGSQGVSSSGGGLVIKRTGEVTGSASGGSLNITLEGGGMNWEGALTQDNVAPYYTRAQRTVLASLLKYIDTMSNAEVDNQLDKTN
jgi:hypothetical protein